MNDKPQDEAVRLAHLESTVGGLRGDFSELKTTLARLFDRIESLSTRGTPSWQAIIAFVFSGISALSIIGGGIGIVVGLFVRTETEAMKAQQGQMEKVLAVLSEHVDRNSEDRAALAARLQALESEADAARAARFSQRDGESMKEVLRAEIKAAK